MVTFDYKSFERNLICPLDNTKSGLYTIFTYPDSDELTAYHEDTKTEYYLHKDKFKELYKKSS
jgi:hypothetical protein